MRALLYHDARLHFSTTAPAPAPGEEEVLLKVRRSGICNTDLEIVRGYKGFSGIPGHEFVADVIDGAPHLVGRRVVGDINVACGHCPTCDQGVPSQCPQRTTVGIDRHDGAFADLLTLSRHNLHLVPDTVSDDAAVFVEPLAAALQVLEAVHIAPRDRVVLIGAGKLGMLVAQVLRLHGADLRVLVRRDKQAALLHRWSIHAVRREELPPRSADVVIDCTGTAEGFSAALHLVRPRGKLILKSTYQGLPQADLSRVVVDEVHVIGSRCGPFAPALRLLALGLIDTESLIDARYPLDQALTAFEHAGRPGALKVLLEH
ncbi:MAG: alcohol dehydrogenase catalytic domain-containing protein [Anaerolineae bacterium]|nr:alcohol dehydrogenase catalytic domain-containing protein [Anaerolineae bacterium]